MPYVIHTEQGTGVLCVWSGVATGQEMHTATVEIYQPTALAKLRYQIWDFSKATDITASGEDMRLLAMLDDQASKANPQLISAMVGPPHLFLGAARVYHIYLEIWAPSLPSRHFSNLQAARDWIAATLTSCTDKTQSARAE
jgi:hypothetical protein